MPRRILQFFDFTSGIVILFLSHFSVTHFSHTFLSHFSVSLFFHTFLSHFSVIFSVKFFCHTFCHTFCQIFLSHFSVTLLYHTFLSHSFVTLFCHTFLSHFFENAFCLFLGQISIQPKKWGVWWNGGLIYLLQTFRKDINQYILFSNINFTGLFNSM